MKLDFNSLSDPDDIQNSLSKTSGYKKLFNYFEEVLNTEKFSTSIISLRKKYGLSEQGIRGSDDFMDLFPKLTDELERNKLFQEDLYTLLLEYGLDPLMWSTELTEYIVADEFSAEPYVALCNVWDYKKFVLRNEEIFSTRINDKDIYPVVLGISPFASERDIIDHIKHTYTEVIKPLQEKYKRQELKIGSVKRKKPKIKERNEFIYYNKDLPRREIMGLVSDKFGEHLDYGHIGKIISLMEKKRKEL
ncbi:MAG: hypothetical protein AB199_03500 [Parcubacteria bacterium C7867-004]|nr:MAG: hypothetical protein AB199_03500 [Parcubacteria bacterium C7867-004]